MKKLLLLGILGVMCCIAILFLIQTPVEAQKAIQAQPITHVGQPASNLVTLVTVGGVLGGCGPSLMDFARLMPNGTYEAQPGNNGWRVPQGMVLVITDIDWQFHSADMQYQDLVIRVESLADPYRSDIIYVSSLTLVPDGAGGFYGGKSDNLTTGFVINSKVRLCCDAGPSNGPLMGLRLHGYLALER